MTTDNDNDNMLSHTHTRTMKTCRTHTATQPSLSSTSSVSHFCFSLLTVVYYCCAIVIVIVVYVGPHGLGPFPVLLAPPLRGCCMYSLVPGCLFIIIVIINIRATPHTLHFVSHIPQVHRVCECSCQAGIGNTRREQQLWQLNDSVRKL